MTLLTDSFYWDLPERVIHYKGDDSDVWEFPLLYTWLKIEFESPNMMNELFPMSLHWTGPVMINGWSLSPDACRHLKMWELHLRFYANDPYQPKVAQ